MMIVSESKLPDVRRVRQPSVRHHLLGGVGRGRSFIRRSWEVWRQRQGSTKQRPREGEGQSILPQGLDTCAFFGSDLKSIARTVSCGSLFRSLRRVLPFKIFTMKSTDETTWIQSDTQSTLTTDELRCGDCAHPIHGAPRLEKSGEQTTESAFTEEFECLDCGATGGLRQQHDRELVTQYGCITTPRRLDIERASAHARRTGGRYQ